MESYSHRKRESTIGRTAEYLDGTITTTTLMMMTTTNISIVGGVAIITAATVDSVEADQKNEKSEHHGEGVLGTRIGPVHLQQIKTNIVTGNANEPDLYRRHLRWVHLLLKIPIRSPVGGRSLLDIGQEGKRAPTSHQPPKSQTPIP